MFTYLFDGFLRRVFSLLRAGRILYIHNALAWRHRSSLSKILSAFFTQSLGPRFTPSVHGDISLQNWFSFTLFPLTERRCHFRFRVLANHFASFFFPVRRLLRTSICLVYPFFIHPVTECKHLLAFTLTHILYFFRQAGRSWPTLRFLFLTVSLCRPVNLNTEGCRNSLSLLSVVGHVTLDSFDGSIVGGIRQSVIKQMRLHN